MTKEDGIFYLNEWLEDILSATMEKWKVMDPKSKGRLNFGWKCIDHITSGVEYVWLNGLADELESRINKSSWDPVTVVADYIEEMDCVMALSDRSHMITHRFCVFMIDNAHDLLWYLMRKENLRTGELWSRRDETIRMIQSELAMQGIVYDAKNFVV